MFPAAHYPIIDQRSGKKYKTWTVLTYNFYFVTWRVECRYMNARIGIYTENYESIEKTTIQRFEVFHLEESTFLTEKKSAVVGSVFIF